MMMMIKYVLKVELIKLMLKPCIQVFLIILTNKINKLLIYLKLNKIKILIFRLN